MEMNVLSISLIGDKMGWSVMNNRTFELITYGEIEIKRKTTETIQEYTLAMNEILFKLINENNTPIINLQVDEKESKLESNILVKALLYLIIHTNNLKLIHTEIEDCLLALDIRLAKGELDRQAIEWTNNKYNIGLIYRKNSSKTNQHVIAYSICLASYYLGNFETIIRFGRFRNRK